VGAAVPLGGAQRLFFAAFAEKIAKINRERMVANEFLPDALRYQRLMISVKPIEGHPSFKKSRDFVFSDTTTASECITAFPELSRHPFNEALKTVLDQIRRKKLDDAAKGLQRLEEILSDLPTDVRLRVLWNWANVRSLRAESLPKSPRKRKEALHRGTEYLKRWYEYGIGGAWSELGMTPENEHDGPRDELPVSVAQGALQEMARGRWRAAHPRQFVRGRDASPLACRSKRLAATC